MRFIFVTGGVVSGLGKGITAASLGKLLKTAGHSVTVIKLDPYLQIDAGTMSPYEHGETFVTHDGFETDLDLGHYERFLNQDLTKDSSITTGQIYQHIIQQERAGKYLGQTIQVIPHVTDEIKQRIIHQGSDYDITIVEVGGTIGDIEGPHFIEAIRQLRSDYGHDRTIYIHVAPIIHLRFSGEMKTKPIQHSVKELTRLGIHADFLMCRTELPLTEDIKDKLALFCDIDKQYIIEGKDVQSIYQVPKLLQAQHIDILVQERLGLTAQSAQLTTRNTMTDNFLHPQQSITIGIVGKYAKLQDAYLSVIEALKHAGAHHTTQIHLERIPATIFTHEDKQAAFFAEHDIDGLLIPGGFGTRGLAGKIAAADYARKHKIPYLGLCLGLQMAVVAFARYVCGLEAAHTIEADPQTPDPLITRMPGQSENLEKGGSMRLGSYTSKLRKGSQVAKLYKTTTITERHRHRYEVNPNYYDLLEEHGMVLSGRDQDNNLVEFIELPDHPFFIATQAHPEFRSRLDNPHPLFMGFVEACLR